MDWWELSEMTVHPENIVSGRGDRRMKQAASVDHHLVENKS
jgi:hypothetical protein